MTKPLASLSLDLDNKWSYMKTHGDPGWEEFPSYLDLVVPRVLEFLKQRDLTITFFVVGQDAALQKNHAALRSLADHGHEIGNHSFKHEPWLHLYSDEALQQELADAEEAIERATGYQPIGFRGPGFSFSESTLRTLQRRGYHYDGSTFPTFLGPLARAYYFMKSGLDKEARAVRKRLFGSFSEGFRPLRTYRWKSFGLQLLEIPVTTMPVFKVPIHLSYILYLGQWSPLLAMSYFRFSMAMCRLFRVEPSILLHPLDFMGADDDADLGFFPGMNMRSRKKLDIVAEALDYLRNQFEVVPMMDHAARHNTRHQSSFATA